jgi:hypothetical protein
MSERVTGSSGTPGWSRELDGAYRLALVASAALGIGTPLLFSVLLISKVIPPGNLLTAELVLQVGYLFTGLVFLAAAWSFWRSGVALSEFHKADPTLRAGILLRHGILHAGLSELSCLLGVTYWVLAGAVAGRHCWGFILLTPLLTAGGVPWKARWKQALDG